MATKKEQNVFAKEILAEIGKHADELPKKKKITGILSMKGELYNQKLMVVGRAPNGWCVDGILPRKLDDPTTSEDFAKKVFDSVFEENGGCPMTWVTNEWGVKNGYNTKRSAFWRVIRKVVLGTPAITNIDETSWPSHLVWSNLYKAAPAERGNPNTKLCDIQLYGCLSLFKLELKTYRPKRLLLLTGFDWAEPFLEHVSANVRRSSSRYVEATGQINLDGTITKFVVAVHPQGKPEGKWVKKVMEAFSK